VGAATRQLAWASRATARHVHVWREKACVIPDHPIRRDALNSLVRKRGHIDGAALFSIIPRQRSETLIRLLVAYQVMFDFLDSVNERSAHASLANGVQLHLALVDALNPDGPQVDYFAHHPWRDDGGYLAALVDVCRRACALLPGFQCVRGLLLREALGFKVLALNHIPAAFERDTALRGWGVGAQSESRAATWFELAAGGSSSLAIHTLLALATETTPLSVDLDGIRRRYVEVIAVMATMLDSYVDQLEDVANGDHSYVAHYPTSQTRVARIQRLIQRSFREALALPDGERHAVIVACMVALYLSKDSARAGELRESSERLAAAGGSLTELLLPILRVWRIAYSQRSC
jgi:tetraprenyl-beta-curcumene synthase